MVVVPLHPDELLWTRLIPQIWHEGVDPVLIREVDHRYGVIPTEARIGTTVAPSRSDELAHLVKVMDLGSGSWTTGSW